jgi:drug/metabolite transporter (DMT)-like permease
VSTRAWALFAAVSVLWGIPYLLIKVALDGGLSPAFLAWVRVLLGAAVLAPYAWRARGLLRGRGRRLAAFSLVEIVLPALLIGYAEQLVSSSLAAIVISAAPLFVAVLALRYDVSERVGGTRLVGLVLGLAGVTAIVGIDAGGSAADLLGAAALLAAALCYAAGPMLLKRHLTDLDPRASIGSSLAVAVVLLTPAGIADAPAALPSSSALLAVLGLGTLCSAAALVLYGALIAEAGAARAVVITYVNPLVAVALGAALLGERIGPGAVAGLVLVLAGSWLATRRTGPATRKVRPLQSATAT